MNINPLINAFLESDNPRITPWRLIELLEASVHRPPRSSVFVASFADEWGRQVQKTTGQRDRTQAQAVANEMEAEAKQRRLAHGSLPKKPTIRVRPGSPEQEAGRLSHREIASLWGLSERTVRKIERDALRKLFHNPDLRAFWKEYTGGEIAEAALPISEDWTLTAKEIVALLAMTKTPLEYSAVVKALVLTGQWPSNGGM
jgi:Sigma-70, region 4